MKRFGVSLEDKLLVELDRFVKKNKLSNRSQAIRFLIRKNVTEEDWEKDRMVSGCVVLVYDHHRRDLLSQAMHIQHDFQHLVLSTQHVHLDHDNCLETIILKGRAGELKKLADMLIGLKGMKFGKLTMSSLGKK